MRRDSLAFRLVASAALWCALLLSACGLGLSALFADTMEGAFDQRLAVLLEGLVAGSELSENEEGRLELRPQLGEPRFEQPLSGWYWQISRPTPGPTPSVLVRRSASLWDHTLRLALGPDEAVRREDIDGPAGQRLRILTRAITLPGSSMPLLYAVAGDRSEISLERQRFDRLLMSLLSVLFFGLVIAVFLQVRFALEPLRRMERALADIRIGRSRRLQGPFVHEIHPLAHELNALLDHNEALIERARTHAGNLAHGLKTPLAVLTNEAERSAEPLAEVVRRQAAIMRGQVEHHLTRARTAASASVLGARTEVAPVLADLTRTLARIYTDKALALESRCAPEIAFRGARQDLEEMLGNLLDNACKWARSQVQVAARVEGDRLVITVEDDGPGLAPEQRAAVLQRGRRLDERVPGSGLGLAIVTDVAELYGGHIALHDAELGGLCARLELPSPPRA